MFLAYTINDIYTLAQQKVRSTCSKPNLPQLKILASSTLQNIDKTKCKMNISSNSHHHTSHVTIRSLDLFMPKLALDDHHQASPSASRKPSQTKKARRCPQKSSRTPRVDADLPSWAQFGCECSADNCPANVRPHLDKASWEFLGPSWVHLRATWVPSWNCRSFICLHIAQAKSRIPLDSP